MFDSRRGKYTLDNNSALRAGANGTHFTWFEVSLPRLLFGDNCRLIDSQAQIDQAFARADKIISEWARPAEGPRRFTRVDLVWHFRANPPQDFLFAHQSCIHPEVKKSFIVIRNHHTVNTIEWRGLAMRIKMYVKEKKHAKLPRQIVRVEIELRVSVRGQNHPLFRGSKPPTL